MKRFYLIFMLGLLSLIVLTACGSAKGESLAVAPVTGDTSTETQAGVQVSPDETQVGVAEIEVDEPELSGLALVGNTDHPQFLESFATW